MITLIIVRQTQIKKFEKQKKLAKKIHQQFQELPLEKENNHLEKINEMLQEILEE